MEQQELLLRLDEALEDIPEELLSFLFDGEFDAVFQPYVTSIPNIELFEGLKNQVRHYILGIVAFEEVKKVVENVSENKTVVANLKRDIEEKIIQEILLILEIHIEMETNTKNSGVISSTETNMFSRLTQSFTNGATIAPKKRDYTDLNTPKVPQPNQETPKPALDPYREIPEL